MYDIILDVGYSTSKCATYSVQWSQVHKSHKIPVAAGQIHPESVLSLDDDAGFEVVMNVR